MKTIKISAESYTILKNFNCYHRVINIIIAKSVNGYGLRCFFCDDDQLRIYNFGIAVLNGNSLYCGD